MGQGADGSSILLGRKYEGLEDGQMIVVSGDRSDAKGAVSELARIAGVEPEEALTTTYTRLNLQTALENSYKADTVTINANVAPATHGETKEEVLGSGDAAQPYQRFRLCHPPLTHVPDGTAGRRRHPDAPAEEEGC